MPSNDFYSYAFGRGLPSLVDPGGILSSLSPEARAAVIEAVMNMNPDLNPAVTPTSGARPYGGPGSSHTAPIGESPAVDLRTKDMQAVGISPAATPAQQLDDVLTTGGWRGTETAMPGVSFAEPIDIGYSPKDLAIADQIDAMRGAGFQQGDFAPQGWSGVPGKIDQHTHFNMNPFFSDPTHMHGGTGRGPATELALSKFGTTPEDFSGMFGAPPAQTFTGQPSGIPGMSMAPAPVQPGRGPAMRGEPMAAPAPISANVPMSVAPVEPGAPMHSEVAQGLNPTAPAAMGSPLAGVATGGLDPLGQRSDFPSLSPVAPAPIGIGSPGIEAGTGLAASEIEAGTGALSGSGFSPSPMTAPAPIGVADAFAGGHGGITFADAPAGLTAADPGMLGMADMPVGDPSPSPMVAPAPISPSPAPAGPVEAGTGMVAAPAPAPAPPAPPGGEVEPGTGLVANPAQNIASALDQEVQAINAMSQPTPAPQAKPPEQGPPMAPAPVPTPAPAAPQSSPLEVTVTPGPQAPAPPPYVPTPHPLPQPKPEVPPMGLMSLLSGLFGGQATASPFGDTMFGGGPSFGGGNMGGVGTAGFGSPGGFAGSALGGMTAGIGAQGAPGRGGPGIF